MELIKTTLNDRDIKRQVYKLDDRYRKIWYGEDSEKWLRTECLEYHITILETFMPGFVLDYGMINNEKMFIDYKIILGKPASSFKRTNKFVNKIKNFCKEHLISTWPYAHYDWQLNNILIHNDNINLIDWDNVKKWDSEYSLNEMIDVCNRQIDQIGPIYKLVVYS